jgi:hypothetical protein
MGINGSYVMSDITSRFKDTSSETVLRLTRVHGVFPQADFLTTVNRTMPVFWNITRGASFRYRTCPPQPPRGSKRTKLSSLRR